MINQLNPTLARTNVDDLLRAAAQERIASAQRPPRRRPAATLARLRAARLRGRLPAVVRSAAPR